MLGGVVALESQSDFVVASCFEEEADSLFVLKDSESSFWKIFAKNCLADHFDVLISWLPFRYSFFVELPQSCSPSLLCKRRDLRAPDFLFRRLAKLWLDLALLKHCETLRGSDAHTSSCRGLRVARNNEGRVWCRE